MVFKDKLKKLAGIVRKFANLYEAGFDEGGKEDEFEKIQGLPGSYSETLGEKYYPYKAMNRTQARNLINDKIWELYGKYEPTETDKLKQEIMRRDIDDSVYETVYGVIDYRVRERLYRGLNFDEVNERLMGMGEKTDLVTVVKNMLFDFVDKISEIHQSGRADVDDEKVMREMVEHFIIRNVNMRINYYTKQEAGRSVVDLYKPIRNILTGIIYKDKKSYKSQRETREKPFEFELPDGSVIGGDLIMQQGLNPKVSKQDFKNQFGKNVLPIAYNYVVDNMKNRVVLGLEKINEVRPDVDLTLVGLFTPEGGSPEDAEESLKGYYSGGSFGVKELHREFIRNLAVKTGGTVIDKNTNKPVSFDDQAQEGEVNFSSLYKKVVGDKKKKDLNLLLDIDGNIFNIPSEQTIRRNILPTMKEFEQAIFSPYITEKPISIDKDVEGDEGEMTVVDIMTPEGRGESVQTPERIVTRETRQAFYDLFNKYSQDIQQKVLDFNNFLVELQQSGIEQIDTSVIRDVKIDKILKSNPQINQEQLEQMLQDPQYDLTSEEMERIKIEKIEELKVQIRDKVFGILRSVAFYTLAEYIRDPELQSQLIKGAQEGMINLSKLQKKFVENLVMFGLGKEQIEQRMDDIFGPGASSKIRLNLGVMDEKNPQLRNLLIKSIKSLPELEQYVKDVKEEYGISKEFFRMLGMSKTASYDSDLRDFRIALIFHSIDKLFY